MPKIDPEKKREYNKKFREKLKQQKEENESNPDIEIEKIPVKQPKKQPQPQETKEDIINRLIGEDSESDAEEENENNIELTMEDIVEIIDRKCEKRFREQDKYIKNLQKKIKSKYIWEEEPEKPKKITESQTYDFIKNIGQTLCLAGIPILTRYLGNSLSRNTQQTLLNPQQTQLNRPSTAQQPQYANLNNL